ncbi:hypothetical protein P13BB106kb_p015 [Pectobacterium phage DU_PP_V]|uniref:Uncharacterized protein n=1 Tax=Pectobacterium phage DU_PP_V TaxID=2041492 RepID=A0A2D2W6S7_9CAUD|nr:hypothetical protein HOS40_gp015 [Pectobacterium phage DU_PP_V]ATS93999.1 hypothetical protein P13BB106kb_p015 [Pectobacterium phage DU_PP_V]
MKDLITEILDLPSKVSEMSLRQKQLTDLVMVRSVYNPELKNHIALDSARRSGDIHILPRVLKLSKVTFLGFLESKTEVTPSDRELLLSKLVEEDEHLDWEELGFPPNKKEVITDYYDYCLNSYLTGDYVSPRNFKGKDYKTFSKSGGLKPFFFTEAPYKRERAEIDFTIITRKAIIIHDLNINADFLLENKVLKYSELTEDEKYAVQFFCELRLIDPKTQRLSGNPTHVIFYPSANRLKAAGYSARSTPAKNRRVEIDQEITWYPEANEPKLGEIPYADKELLRHPKFTEDTILNKEDIVPLVIYELSKLYLDIKKGAELEQYQEAIRYQASVNHQELARILEQPQLALYDDAFDTIYRQNIKEGKNPVKGTQPARGLSKTFLAEFIFFARQKVYLYSDV